MQWPRWSEAVLALVALLAAGLIGFGVGGAKTAPTTGRLTVTASGTLQVTPNVAQVNLGTSVQASTAQGALAKLTVASAAIVTAVEKDGISAKDIQTSNLNVGQRYDNQNQPSGYQANEQFNITVRKVSDAGKVASLAMAAGANQFNNVSYSELDPNAGTRQAVQQALQAAKKQAKAEASQLGVTLGKVVSVSLQNQAAPGPIFAARAAVQASPAILEPGTQIVTVQVHVTYSYQ
ncbi:MAG: SIMPL domain-containing protein [Thermaerobacter sp.]|nr:SIMPL domain-containing protein [Thermaerobacter sp.]